MVKQAISSMSLAVGGWPRGHTLGSYSSPPQKEGNMATGGRLQAAESTEVLASGTKGIRKDHFSVSETEWLAWRQNSWLRVAGAQAGKLQCRKRVMRLHLLGQICPATATQAESHDP